MLLPAVLTLRLHRGRLVPGPLPDYQVPVIAAPAQADSLTTPASRCRSWSGSKGLAGSGPQRPQAALGFPHARAVALEERPQVRRQVLPQRLLVALLGRILPEGAIGYQGLVVPA